MGDKYFMWLYSSSGDTAFLNDYVTVYLFSFIFEYFSYFLTDILRGPMWDSTMQGFTPK